MFRRGNGSIIERDGGGLTLTRPVLHFTALCWMGITGLVAFAAPRVLTIGDLHPHLLEP